MSVESILLRYKLQERHNAILKTVKTRSQMIHQYSQITQQYRAHGKQRYVNRHRAIQTMVNDA